MGTFTDKVVLITGAGRGIGRDLALAFAAGGGRIAANDLTPVNLDPLVTQIQGEGGHARAYEADISKKMGVQALVTQIMEAWGRIDILVNGAGVKPNRPILTMDEWDWRRTIDVNLTGPFFTLQTVGRVMEAQGSGVIVNLGSSLEAGVYPPELAGYVASKAGLIGLTRAASAAFADTPIRVYAVCPALPSVKNHSENRQRLIGPAGEPLDVIPGVLYLCSAEAQAVRGPIFHVPDVEPTPG